MTWKPVRKIAAALVPTLAGEGGVLTLWLSGVIDWREALAGALAIAAPVVVGYLTPERR